MDIGAYIVEVSNTNEIAAFHRALPSACRAVELDAEDVRVAYATSAALNNRLVVHLTNNAASDPYAFVVAHPKLAPYLADSFAEAAELETTPVLWTVCYEHRSEGTYVIEWGNLVVESEDIAQSVAPLQRLAKKLKMRTQELFDLLLTPAMASIPIESALPQTSLELLTRRMQAQQVGADLTQENDANLRVYMPRAYVVEASVLASKRGSSLGELLFSVWTSSKADLDVETGHAPTSSVDKQDKVEIAVRVQPSMLAELNAMREATDRTHSNLVVRAYERARPQLIV